MSAIDSGTQTAIGALAILIGWIGLSYAATQIESDLWRFVVGSISLVVMLLILSTIGVFQ